jgi:hypothetical protein
MKMLETEGGSTRSHNVENSLWKRLWTCRKTDCGLNEWLHTNYRLTNTRIEKQCEEIVEKGCSKYMQFSVPHDVKVKSHSNVGAGWEWVVNARPRSFYPPERNPVRMHLTGGCVGPRTGMNGSGLKKISCDRRGSKPEPHNIALISVYHI